jgi:hypothetical protein
MRVDLEEIRWMQQRTATINGAPLDSIEWYEKGEKIAVDPEKVADWKFVGMSNEYFAVEYLI